jgi:hypothetical protein
MFLNHDEPELGVRAFQLDLAAPSALRAGGCRHALADYGIAHTMLAMGLNKSNLECCFCFQRKIHHMRTRWVGAVFSNTTYPMKQAQPVLALAFLPSNRLLFRM